MDLHLNGRVVLVTGGAKGIGEAIVRQLVEENATPVILDVDEAAGRKLSFALSGHATFFGINLHSSDACKSTINDIIKQLGKIDGLVNNAGVNDTVGLEKGSPARFNESLINNSSHYYYMAHYCLPHLKATKGSIVNVGSKTAVTGQGNTSGYAAAKGAILAFTREWAVELLPFGIRVNAVIPAEVWTPMYESWVNTFDNPKEKLQTITDKIPFENRMTTPAEIANMVTFLLSSRAGHITGQWIHVDGGYVHLDRAIR